MGDDLEIINGGSYADERGTITFINDFDMQLVKRFYRIKHHDTSIVRGWRGHKIEQRWFHVSTGTFQVKLIKIDNWKNPGKDLKIEVMVLSADENAVLYIPAGYASAIQSIEVNSELIVFADYAIDHAKHDDYLFPIDYFQDKN